MSFGKGRTVGAEEIIREALKGRDARRAEAGDSVVFDKATGAFIRTGKDGESFGLTFENGMKNYVPETAVRLTEKHLNEMGRVDQAMHGKKSYHEAGLKAARESLRKNRQSFSYAEKIQQMMEHQRQVENLRGPQSIADMVSNMQNELRKLRGIGSAQEQFADNHETIEEIRRSLEGETPSGSMITADTIRVSKLEAAKTVVHAPIPSGPVATGPLTPRPMSKKPQSYEGWSMDLARWERGLESGRRQEFRERRMELERQLKEEFERGR